MHKHKTLHSIKTAPLRINLEANTDNRFSKMINRNKTRVRQGALFFFSRSSLGPKHIFLVCSEFNFFCCLTLQINDKLATNNSLKEGKLDMKWEVRGKISAYVIGNPVIKTLQTMRQKADFISIATASFSSPQRNVKSSLKRRSPSTFLHALWKPGNTLISLLRHYLKPQASEAVTWEVVALVVLVTALLGSLMWDTSWLFLDYHPQ